MSLFYLNYWDHPIEATQYKSINNPFIEDQIQYLLQL